MAVSADFQPALDLLSELRDSADGEVGEKLERVRRALEKVLDEPFESDRALTDFLSEHADPDHPA